MKKRKTIGLITATPETVYSIRAIKGITAQCEKYGYDVAVFSSLTHLCGDKKRYIEGEINIYELPNYDMLDGIIVDSIPLTENNTEYIQEKIKNNLENKCHIPVEVLSLPLGNFDMVTCDDSIIFKEITEHILDVHKCTDIYFLSGQKGNSVGEARLSVYKEVMSERNLPVDDSSIFYGDFWYTSGYSLADKIFSGEIHKPEAVICASDHMAIGLVNRLSELGMNIPKDLIVTGFEATPEALLNDISVTTFESNASKAAADAVDIIRSKIEPDENILPYDATASHIHTGMSCGCIPNILYSYKDFKPSFYHMNHDFASSDPYANVDIGLLMDNYMSEALMGTSSPEECLKEIYHHTHLMRPYHKFFLCLKEDWLDYDSDIITGYPPKMKLSIVASTCGEAEFYDDSESIVFDTKQMLPELFDERSEPYIFYFSPVHFQDITLGYSVVQKKMSDCELNIVYRNWLRFVNLSLEMIRAKNRLTNLSVYDEMTGAFNRRGMKVKLAEMTSKAHTDDKAFVSVIDMDGLKYINDTYGHEEGDLGIRLVAQAAFSITDIDEICVRAGGDEFYIIGIGKYDEERIRQKQIMFETFLKNKSDKLNKSYTVSASIGFAYEQYSNDISISEVIKNADMDMYRNKIERRKQRI